MPAHSAIGSLAIEETAFQAILSVGGMQSKTGSEREIVMIGTAGSSSDDESSRLSSQISSDSLSRHDGESYSREMRGKQLKDIRAARMRSRMTDEVLEFECPVEELAARLRTEFDQLVRRERINAVTVYQIVINSLVKYFQKDESGLRSVESSISAFLSAHFIGDVDRTREVMEEEGRDMDSAMVEVVSLILLLLYVACHAPERAEKSEIVRRLRYIYIHNSAAALRGVLEEEITDVFLPTLPLLLGDLFVDVGVDEHIPMDLEERIERERSNVHQSSLPSSSSPMSTSALFPPEESSASPREESQREKEKGTPPVMGLKPSLSSRLEAMLCEFLSEDEPSSEGRGGASQGGKSQVKSQKRSSQAVPSTPNREERRLRARRVFVPETPDEKNGEGEGRRTRSQMKEEVKGIVKQTPMEKVMRARRSTRGEKLAEMVKRAADSPSLTGGVVSAVRRREEGRSMRSGNVLFPQDTKPTSRAEFLSANRDRGEKRSRVRMNLEERMGGERREGREERERGEKRERKEEKEERQKKKRRVEGDIGSLSLDAEAISKYKKRMRETAAEGGPMDESEVFYGRMSNRVGLFDDRHEKEEAKVVYNRAGRVVYSPSCVFVAHTLLNVHNKNPLIPIKASSTTSEFRLNRLVRPASKGNRLKLKKLKERLSSISPKKEVKKEQ